MEAIRRGPSTTTLRVQSPSREAVKTDGLVHDWAAMNAVYATYVGSPSPARTTVEVVRLAAGALVEIDAVAARPAR